MDRAEATAVVSRLMGGRPTRWAPGELTVGDYDGRERTLEIFNAAAGEQVALLRAIRSVRADLKEAAGGPVVFIFHTPEESQRLYAGFLDEFPRPVETPPVQILAGLGARQDQEVLVDESRPHRRVAA